MRHLLYQAIDRHLLPVMKAYVINLARATDRRAHMERQLARAEIDYEFVEAVDGRDLDVTDPSLVASEWLGRSPFFPNVAGCALSHRLVYRRVACEGQPSALVLEDDMVLSPHLADMLIALEEHLEGVGAEVVLLNYHSPVPVELYRRGSVGLPGSRLLVDPVNLKLIGSAGAYVITPEGSKRMAEAVLPVRVAQDDWSYYAAEHAFDRLRCVTPMPVRKSAAFRSTIGYYKVGSLRAMASSVLNVLPVQRALTARRQRIANTWEREELL